MERLRDVLNGTWAGSYGYEGRYQTHRTDTRFQLSCQISPSTGKLEITGSGRDFTGNFRFEGAATSPTEIAMTKLIGPANNWWHKATVNLNKREMRGNWGGAWYPNKEDGSLVFQRQMTQEEIQREAEAARRAADEAKRKQEEEAAAAAVAAAAARKKQEEEEAAAAAARQKREEEEEEAAAKKKQQDAEEAARKKQQQENEEAARKQREESEAAKAAKKEEEEQAERARKEREDAEKARQEESGNALQKRKGAEQLASRQLSTAQTTNTPLGKPAVSIKDSDDGVAGNVKVHLKVDVDADIRVIAALRGDIAIGIL